MHQAMVGCRGRVYHGTDGKVCEGVVTEAYASSCVRMLMDEHMGHSQSARARMAHVPSNARPLVYADICVCAQVCPPLQSAPPVQRSR